MDKRLSCLRIRQFPTHRALHPACKSCSTSLARIHPSAKYTLEPLLRLGDGSWGIPSLPPTVLHPTPSSCEKFRKMLQGQASVGSASAPFPSKLRKVRSFGFSYRKHEKTEDQTQVF